MAVLAAGWAISVSASTVHADEGWIITSFHSDITVATIDPHGHRDIRVDFGSLQKRGIFRTIRSDVLCDREGRIGRDRDV